jgi:hypothetical protein
MVDTMKKMTKREMFNQIMEKLTDQAEIDFIAHEIELLENKAGAHRKPTATQVANESLKVVILNYLETVDSASVTDVQKYIGNDITNQKVSALLKQLVESNQVNKFYEKRKAYFSVR